MEINMPCREDLPLAVPYVRRQKWEEPLSPAQGLRTGTIFASLDLPYNGYVAKK